MFTLEHWEKYHNDPAPVFKTRKQAEKVAQTLRELRAWVNVVRKED